MSFSLHQRSFKDKIRAFILHVWIDLKKSGRRFAHFSDAPQNLHTVISNEGTWDFSKIICWKYFIRQCFICRPSNSAMSEEVGIEPPRAVFLSADTKRGWTNNITSMLSALKNHQNHVCSLYTSTMKLRVIKRCFPSVLLVWSAFYCLFLQLQILQLN